MIRSSMDQMEIKVWGMKETFLSVFSLYENSVIFGKYSCWVCLICCPIVFQQVLNDPIHGLIELHPLLIKIMDTPHVAHLAGELARALKSKQSELEIDDRDILCVQIAGLCHDLGHGPFSHLYDGLFIPEHEDASLCMFDHLVEENGLKPLMELYDLNPYGKEENDLVFIKEMIQGKPPTEAKVQTSWPYKGRTEEKSFLYEIVANKLNGIDVDKFDYLARDAYHLGMQSNFDHKRFIMLARVCEKFKKHICSRDKEVGNLYDMFHTRYCLHRRVCQHKTHKAIELMIRDAFLKADEHIKTEGSRGEMFKLSTAKDDMEAYTKLTDQVFERILHPCSSSCPELKEASKILQRIVSRNLYKFVGETKVCSKVLMSLYYIWFVMAGDHIVTFDYGKEEEDPINNTYFYSKCNPNKGFKIPENQKSKLLPANFSETIMRVYCKNAENVNLEGARKAFEDWCSKNGFAVPEVIFRYSMLKVQCEAGVPGENPRMHRENMQTPCRKIPGKPGREPGTFLLQGESANHYATVQPPL
uniref:HD domain-containing protein n=1 Tax=Amphiprion percula TaxID=161767 RepID=A0A3P8SD89_AMPPE